MSGYLLDPQTHSSHREGLVHGHITGNVPNFGQIDARTSQTSHKEERRDDEIQVSGKNVHRLAIYTFKC